MGHEIPDKRTIFQFKHVVEKFLRDNRDNGKRGSPSLWWDFGESP